VENDAENVRVYYSIEEDISAKGDARKESLEAKTISTPNFIGQLLDLQRDALDEIQLSDVPILQLRLGLLGPKSMLADLTKRIPLVPQPDRQQVGIVVNEVKRKIEKALHDKASEVPNVSTASSEWFDVTEPGIRPPEGHLHIVTQAITEITRIFERIGFTRVRHPEVDWDWYAFTSLNMPSTHPAYDEWETFIIQSVSDRKQSPIRDRMVLTPHTSNGQVREMEKGKLPIRMINIAKCYRRQIDVSHTPMFHQFEGMYIDKNVSIGHLKGFIDFFVKQYFGPDRKFRLRPFHFQFTEPSFEVDISCDICNGRGCRLCKEGWLELAGSGMIHPVVLRNGGVDPNKYSGFAIGWGIERTYMMKTGTQLDDIRLIYSNDIRFLEQF
ncbi:phenylalanine--tRNA ligase subunit alpha, partial [Patescibacteria group bacterium]|nr:phenylalanine--tRNA ligase subunit alpha [Patescibacteria group bacterium]